MKLNEIIHGFKIERIRKSEELKGTLYEMRHLKTGAELAFLDNKEDNKLFSVAFKTLPWDDTGVFHILEHSVLAGSENYPVKEPFLDLLKSSMNTFLNAMTFPDKTMYPVSSRNEQDFINLTRVYLDAVFRPAIYKNESIFRQEGWHYELENGKPFYNGVVFNEMKGALGSVNELMDRVGRAYLFPNSIYGFESGGDPKSIPDLTYENFLKAHREFYSPSNAKIYLDGDVPLERVLSLIDEEYLSTFDYIDKSHKIAMQKPIEETEADSYYEIGKDESGENKTVLSYSKVFASWDEKKRVMAYNLISSYLAGSNEAPLKRAILEKGLAQDVSFYVVDGIAQPYYTIVFRNTEPEKRQEIKKTYLAVLNNIIENGIDREELVANFNQFEFELREAEEPKGLTRNIFALNSWLYGGDMLMYLENDELLKEMRADIDSGYYDEIIKELADFSNTLSLTMLPSKTKGDEDRAAEEKRVSCEYASMTEAEKAKVDEIYNNMRSWQDTPDSPEAVATLPVLSLSDVSKTPMWTQTEDKEIQGRKLLFHKIASNGIVHCNLYFDASDENGETLCELSLLTNLLSVLPTKKHSPAQLQKLIKKTIGELDFNVEAFQNRFNPLESKVYFVVSFSVLENNLAPALDIVKEILLETDYNSKALINENLLQGSELLYRSVMNAGHTFAIKRALCYTSSASYVGEKCEGYSFLCYLNSFIKNFDNDIDKTIAYFEKRAGELFVSSRLVLSETADEYHAEIERLFSELPEGSEAKAVMSFEKQPPQKEAILIPAGISFAVYGANILQYDHSYEGALSVASLLLTYGYLWNEIRVHGGAYGCGFRCGLSGNATFHSYRDPNPLNSVEVYKNTSDFVKSFVKSDESVEKYIISSIAAGEGLLSSAKQGSLADSYYLTDYSYDDKLGTRMQMLNLKKSDLLRLCDLFDKMKNGNSICIVGNKDSLSSLGEDWKKYNL